MKGVGYISEQHLVSAAEAAYTTLVCHFSVDHQGGEWLNNAIPNYAARWPIRLKSFGAEIFRGGVPVHGVPVAMYAMYSSVGALNLINKPQGYLGRSTWIGDWITENGCGLLLRLGAVANGDLIVIGGIYESLR